MSNKSELEQYIIQGLKARGFTDTEAIGIAANMSVESGFNSDINEVSPTVKGSRGGYGLMQWTGPRRRQYEAFAEARGVAPSDINAQLDFTAHELNTTERKAMARLARAEDPTSAARIFSDSYARPGTPNINKRISEAERLAGYGGGDEESVFTPPTQKNRIWTVELEPGKQMKVEAPTADMAWAYANMYAAQAAPAKEAPKGGVMSDIGKALKSGAYQFAQIPANVYGMATGDYDALGGAYLRGKQEELHGQMSPEYLQQEREARAAIAEAEKTGEVAGGLEALYQYATRPRLLAGTAAESVPSMVGGLGAGKLAQAGVASLAKKGLAGAAAEKAAADAAARAALAGQRTTFGTMATQQGGDVAQQAYQNVYNEAIKKGYSEPDARALATSEARKAGLIGGAISYGTMAVLPGVEKGLFQGFGAKTALGGAAKGFLGEAAQEATEEGGGRVAQNIAMQALNPEQSLMQGVGATAAQAGLLGGLFGGPMGGLSTRAEIKHAESVQRIKELNERAAAAREQGRIREAETLKLEAIRQETELRQLMLQEEEQARSPEELAQEQQQVQEQANRQAQEQRQQEQLVQRGQMPPETGAEAEQDELARISSERQQIPTTITDEMLRGWGFNKRMNIYKNLIGKDMTKQEDVEFINTVTQPYEQASPAHIKKLAAIQAQVANTFARFNPTPSPAPEAAQEQAPAEAAPEAAPVEEAAPEAAAPQPTEVVDEKAIAEREAKVQKDADWAKRMAEQAALLQAQREHDAKRNAETAAKLEGAYAAAKEASRQRAERRAAEKAAANGWNEVEAQRALDEEFIVEDTRNKEAFSQAAAGTQGELTGIGSQPAEVAQAGTPSKDELIAQYVDARSRVTTDPSAAEEMRAIDEFGKEQYGSAWTQAKYNAVSRRQGKLDFTGKQAEQAAEKAAAEEAPKAETPPVEPAPTPAAPEIDPVKLFGDLQAISAREGNSDIGKRARMYINEANSDKAVDLAPIAAFAEENKAAPAKPKKAEQKTLEDYEAELAAEENKDEPSKGKIKVLEKKINDLRIGRKPAEKAEVEEAVSADREARVEGVPDPAWEEIHDLLRGETTLSDALIAIRDNRKLGPVYTNLINALLRSKSVQAATFSVESVDKVTNGKVQNGAYNPATNHVRLFNNGGILATLHEAVHAAVYGALETDQAFRAQIQELFDRAKAHIEATEGAPYGITNLQEFVAEAFSSPDFKDVLSRIPSTGTVPTTKNNLWAKFLNAVKSFFGLAENSTSLLDDVISVAAPHMSGEFIPVTKPEAASVARDAALDTLQNMNRSVAVPDTETYVQKAERALKSVSEITPASATRAYVSMADKFRTKFVSANTAFMNAVRRELLAQGRSNKEIAGALINLNDSQAIHSEALAHEYLIRGGVEFDEEVGKYKAVDADNNFVTLHNAVANMMNTHGLTQEEADAIVQAALESRRISAIRKAGNPKGVTLHLTPEQTAAGMSLFETIPELNDIASEWDAIRKNTIKLLKETNVYSEKQAEDYLDSVGYVPFYRDQSEFDNAGTPLQVADNLRVKKEKALKGSEKPVHNLVHNMEKWVMFGVDRAIRNAQAVRMVDYVTENMPEGFITKGRMDDPNAVRILRNGQFEYYEMQDPLFASAFAGLQHFGVQWPKFAVKASNILRNSVVLNPLFGLSQVSQDSFGALFTSGLAPQYAFKIPARALSEFVKTIFGTSKAHAALKAYGAVGAPDVTAAVARMDAEVETGIRKLSKPGLIVRGLRRISMASDNAVRQAIWSLAKDQGLTDAEALEKAFEIINFRRHGTSRNLRSAAQVIPFLNAYVQAMNVAYKTITGEGISPVERRAALNNFATVTGMVMALSALYAMLNGDDEDYLNKDSVVRDRLLMIPGTGFGVPLRTDVFLLPKVLAEHTYLLLTDNATEDGAKMRKSLGHAVANAFSGPTPVPQVLKPAVEVALNHNFFTGRELIGAHLKGEEVWNQYSTSTSELGKLIGKSGLISPIAADHLIRGMLGSVGGATMWTSNVIMSSEPGRSRPDTSTWDLMASLPGMGQFMTKEIGTGLKTDFYDMKNEVDKVVNTFNDLAKRNPEKAREYVLDPDRLKLYGMKSAVNQVTTKLAEIRAAINFITNAPDTMYSPEDKRARIEQLKQTEQNMMKAIDVKRLRGLSGM